MNSKKRYRRFTVIMLIFGCAALGYWSFSCLKNMIPEQIQVSADGEIPVLFHNGLDSVFVMEMVEKTGEVQKQNQAADSENGTGIIKQEKNAPKQETIDVVSDKEIIAEGYLQQTEETDETFIERDASSEYEVNCNLFGVIPLKTVSVSVVPRQKVYAGGTPIGIYMETDGVLVIDTGEIACIDGASCCPAENIVKSGDYIQAVNGETVDTKEALIACIGQSDGADVVLDVERDGKEISLKLTPVKDEEGNYKAGIWVRNDTQGIGTLTYLAEDGSFGALGHGISDIDTGELLKISDGILYDADVISIVKGTQGTPGELSGVIHYSEGYKIGTISHNQKNGIYGTVVGLPAMVENRTLYETAHRQEVEQGAATILSSVDGTCKEYDVEIREIRLNGKDVNKGMILEVTDPELLELTGGIVQGMSGSPIIQEGKLVGAVTHVLVNDPTKGYGIFIENMLEAAE